MSKPKCQMNDRMQILAVWTACRDRFHWGTREVSALPVYIRFRTSVMRRSSRGSALSAVAMTFSMGAGW
jgi:hypothetical protein